ncbi:MAG: PKD domain-containing protein [Ginsengibacter sp.]
MTRCKYITLFVVLSFAFSIVEGQLKADFKAIPTEGCAPLFVEFQDSSLGNPIRWIWDLGNNTTAEVKDPTTTYFSTGIYTIKLKIFNAGGDSAEIIKNQYINVTTTPNVDFSASAIQGCAPLNVLFKDLSDAKNGKIIKWEWDFGDGKIGEGKEPNHLYESGGEYNVTLKVTNNNGCISFQTKKSFIKINPTIKANFSSDFTELCTAPATISFYADVDNGENFDYKWYFGDFKTGSGKNTVNTYNSRGKYNVALIVTNESGCTDTVRKVDYIILGKINASFSAPSSSCSNTAINFQNTTKPLTQSVFWDFGDGTNSGLNNPSKKFQKAGVYNVKMVVRTEDCIDSVINPITIKEGLSLDFDASPAIACKAPLSVNFNNLSPGENTYLWDFGDKAVANSKNASHTYTKVGNYTVTLTAKNNSGCADTLKKDVIQIGLPVVNLNLPVGGCTPLTHQFSANFTPAFKINNYKWNFGDGNTSNSSTPSHQYTKTGSYNVSLIYTTFDGCVDSVKVENAVKVGTPPTVNFKATPLNACAKVPIFFFDLSTNIGDSTSWNWDFGDGGTSIIKNPEYIYQDTGRFDIKLVVRNNGCADSIIFKKYIHIDPPIAAFIYKQNCGVSGNIQFTNKSIGADTWSWDFGDGSTSLDKSPLHIYSKKGEYTVKLTVTNKKSGCSFTKTATISVIEESPDFISNVKEACKNIPVNFSVINVNPVNIRTYIWDFGDGGTKDERDTTTSYKYNVPGTFDVTLTIRDKNNCSTSITKKVFVEIVGPTPEFRAPSPIICKNEVVSFVDSSYTFGSGKIVNWEWNFGDGTPTQNLETGPFIHTYIDTGYYSISLKVTDERGCVDSILKEKEVRVPYVNADFSSDSLSCTYQRINFKNLSVGQGLTYLWNFGDSLTDTKAQLSHNYTMEGIYSVGLLIKDANGCKDSITRENLVTIADPLAELTVNNGFSTCPPLIVQFGNTSQKYLTYEWNFGDNTKSAILNPSHFYGDVGTFKAILTVRGGKGCVDTASSEIEVKGPTGSFTYDILKGCVPLQVNFKAKTKYSDSLRWDFNDGNSSSIKNGIVSHIYEVTGFFEPKLILRDEEGCVVPLRGLDTIKVYGVKAAFSYDTNRICDSQSLQFYSQSSSNDQIEKYHWTFGDNSFSDVKNPIQTYQNPGIYNTILSVTTREGCKDTTKLSSIITVKKTPEIGIRGNSEACVFSDIQFTGLVLKSDQEAISWKWDFGNGQVWDKQNPPNQSYNTAGSYSVKVIANSANGCSDTASHLINLFPLPVINISGEKVICLNNATTLLASGASQYSWIPSPSLSCLDCASPVASPEYSTQYIVIGLSNKGCRSVDSLTVEVKRPFKISVSEKDTVCIGQTVQLSVKGADKYKWSPNSAINDAASANPVVSPARSTTYMVIGQDSKNCFADTGYIPVEVYNYPKVNAGEDKTINVGSTITLTPKISSDVTNIIWTPKIGILDVDEKGAVTMMPKQTTTYNIAVKNAGGCLSLDKVTVFVLCNNANVFVPNTFSPNGDGVNDVFFPHGTGVFKIKNLRIFNRWGQVVFDRSNFMANDMTAGWDGSFRNQKLNSDVFVYTLSVICENNDVLTFKGDVTLIR